MDYLVSMDRFFNAVDRAMDAFVSPPGLHRFGGMRVHSVPCDRLCKERDRPPLGQGQNRERGHLSHQAITTGHSGQRSLTEGGQRKTRLLQIQQEESGCGGRLERGEATPSRQRAQRQRQSLTLGDGGWRQERTGGPGPYPGFLSDDDRGRERGCVSSGFSNLRRKAGSSLVQGRGQGGGTRLDARGPAGLSSRQQQQRREGGDATLVPCERSVLSRGTHPDGDRRKERGEQREGPGIKAKNGGVEVPRLRHLPDKGSDLPGPSGAPTVPPASSSRSRNSNRQAVSASVIGEGPEVLGGTDRTITVDSGRWGSLPESLSVETPLQGSVIRQGERAGWGGGIRGRKSVTVASSGEEVEGWRLLTVRGRLYSSGKGQRGRNSRGRMDEEKGKGGNRFEKRGKEKDTQCAPSSSSTSNESPFVVLEGLLPDQITLAAPGRSAAAAGSAAASGGTVSKRSFMVETEVELWQSVATTSNISGASVSGGLSARGVQSVRCLLVCLHTEKAGPVPSGCHLVAVCLNLDERRLELREYRGPRAPHTLFAFPLPDSVQHQNGGSRTSRSIQDPSRLPPAPLSSPLCLHLLAGVDEGRLSVWINGEVVASSLPLPSVLCPPFPNDPEAIVPGQPAPPQPAMGLQGKGQVVIRRFCLHALPRDTLGTERGAAGVSAASSVSREVAVEVSRPPSGLKSSGEGVRGDAEGGPVNRGNTGGEVRSVQRSVEERGRRQSHASPWCGPAETVAALRSVRPRSSQAGSGAFESKSAEEEALIESVERDMFVGSGGMIKASFSDVGGLRDAKSILNENVLLPLIVPEFFRGGRAPSKGILLFGPPGTGKTLLAKALCATTGLGFYSCSAASLVSKWRGESEKLVRALFTSARRRAPCVVFIDEADALVSTRGESSEHEASRRFKAELLTQMDGICTDMQHDLVAGGGEGRREGDGFGERKKEQQADQVVVLAATNAPWDIDDALRRRLEKRVYVPLPCLEARREMLRIHLKETDVEGDVDLDWVAAETERFSGADISSLCREAAMGPVRRLAAGREPSELRHLLDSGEIFQAPPVEKEDFEEALAAVLPTVSLTQKERYEEWNKKFGTKWNGLSLGAE
uniref:AAA+ ATPase domain-containing protein n=1 Tax=Chromera velia CCMP2878 TaxID=1169474 RepID=A0A0G4HIQ5_9ALVE|eukprot:Cvel_28028.t1-p1 / transcript=Cvel_28028.t1 / gene=Cvel_28028 / organism=Chromera_velia_CCMP2878 / gene_product=Katanin p60 ATPase-containing subunit A1, putative / transcript_product=Katanin p60 ATPase-containing subunit A1, putative / location=Cvel_scaffold3598:5660-13874(-) / protein_length=1099 / sequence_SO=supercontig / SO=protein_coding / is_pseudo=false